MSDRGEPSERDSAREVDPATSDETSADTSEELPDEQASTASHDTAPVLEITKPSVAVRPPNAVADPKRTPRHWPLLVVSFLLLGGAAVLLTGSAMPAVARELGWTHARTVSRTTHRSMDASRAGVDAVKEREQKLALEGQDDEDDDPLGGTQVGVSAQHTTLLRGPASNASPVGSVDRGEKLVVVREDHGFLLVIHHGQAGTDIGWVRKADVLVR